MAVSRDGASGGVIRLCVVSAAGVERWTVVPGAEAGATTAAAAAAAGEGRRRVVGRGANKSSKERTEEDK